MFYFMEVVEVAGHHNRQDCHDQILVVRLGYFRGISEPHVGLDQLGDEERDEGSEDVVRGDLAGEEDEREEKSEEEAIFPQSPPGLRHIELHFIPSAGPSYSKLRKDKLN